MPYNFPMISPFQRESAVPVSTWIGFSIVGPHLPTTVWGPSSYIMVKTPRYPQVLQGLGLALGWLLHQRPGRRDRRHGRVPLGAAGAGAHTTLARAADARRTGCGQAQGTRTVEGQGLNHRTLSYCSSFFFPPARWGSLDFNKGATPSHPHPLRLLHFLLCPLLPVGLVWTRTPCRQLGCE